MEGGEGRRDTQRCLKYHFAALGGCCLVGCPTCLFVLGFFSSYFFGFLREKQASPGNGVA